MPLEEYRRKRDFGKTPEPPPAAPKTTTPAGTGGRFVVQRHRATRLHYDFRLEIDGVLVSWAVPRGPTLDPTQRRMAMHVEDHPIEYLDFEGVIPSRQYGAGDVIVWDWGTWEPEAAEPKPGKPVPPIPEPMAAIREGELKFRLNGEKIRGRFTIVKTNPREGDHGEPWLLIHKNDADAAPGWDAEDHPQSVKTGRTNDEVKEARDALWLSEAPAAIAEVDLAAAVEAPLPAFISPMLATLGDARLRLAGLALRGEVGRLSRPGDRERRQRQDVHPERQRRGPLLPGLLSPVTWLGATSAVVDGEVVALDPDGAPSFELLQQRISGVPEVADAPLVYMAFDLLYLDGRSLLKVPLEDRKRLLKSVLRDHARVRYASHVEGEGRTFFEAAASRHLEGIVAKRRTSRYEPGRRTDNWMKIKVRPEQELVVGGYIPGEGSHKDLGAVLVGVYEGKSLRYAGRVGSGIDAKMRKLLKTRLDALVRATAPFDPAPPRTGELREARFAEPEIVIRAEFAAWTRDNTVRQTAFKGILEGRDPKTVVRERPVDVPRSSDVDTGDQEEDMTPKARSSTKKPSTKAAAPKAPAKAAVKTSTKDAASDRRPRAAELEALGEAREGGRLVGRWPGAQAHQPRQGAVPAAPGHAR